MKRLALSASVATLVLSMPLAQALAEALTVYTSMPKRFAVETVNAFEKQNPGTEVSLFRSGTGNVLSKLRAEATAGAVQADVVMIADEITMEALKRDNRLEAWRDAPVQRMPKGSYDPDMTYFGTKVMSTVLAYNTKLARRPASWKDVLGGDNAGQVVMANAVTSGAALASLSYLTGASGLGWKYFEDLARNKTLVVRANGEVRDMVAKGSRKYGIMLDYMVVAAKKKGSPIDFVYPAEGVVATYQPVAILKGAKNRATARKFVAYLLSPEGQARVVEQGYRPLYPDIKPPAGYPASGEVKIVPVAAEDSVTNAETMKKRFDALFRG